MRRWLGLGLPLEGDEILRVHGERTLGATKALMNAKLDKTKLSDISVVTNLMSVSGKIYQYTQQQVEFRIDLVMELRNCEILHIVLAPSENAMNCMHNFQGLKTKVTYPRFIANFSKVVKPLTSLTERNQKYEWGVEREEFPDFEE
ncbi:hypothetical protein Tco_0417650 [Tanacetum coccineum]